MEKENVCVEKDGRKRKKDGRRIVKEMKVLIEKYGEAIYIVLIGLMFLTAMLVMLKGMGQIGI